MSESLTKTKKGASPAVKLGRGREPRPMEWRVENLVPEKYITILFGAGGLGKSYLAMALAIAVLLGRLFLKREVRKGRVLWIDAEHLGRDEVERRAFQVARGMGLERPPDGLFYYRPKGSVGGDAVLKSVREIIEVEQIDLIILDSLTMGP